MELLVVLVIMGILLSVSVAALSSFSEGPGGPAEAMNEVLVAARTEAARRAQPVQVRVGADGRYEVVTTNSPTLLQDGMLPIEAVEPSPVAITVYPAGTSQSARFRVRWRGAWHRLEIDRVTASVQLLP